MLLVQAVRAWMEVHGGNAGFKPVALMLTVLLVFGITQLVNFVQRGKHE